MSAHADQPHDPTAPAPGESDAHTDHDHAHDPNLAHHFDTMEQQFESGKLGMWVFLATEILMFGGLFCAYAIYRGNNPEIFLFSHQALNRTMGAVNTGVLLASSFTMAVGVKAASQGRQKLLLWMLVITFLGGVGFMTIKSMEYVEKYKKGLFPGTWNAYYTNADGYADPAAKATQQKKTTEYIESHGQPGGHGEAAHGGEHATGGHGDTGHAEEPHGAESPAADSHAKATAGEAEGHGAHAESGHSPAEIAAARPGLNPAVEPGSTTGVNLQQDNDTASAAAAGTLVAQVTAADAPETGSAAWPPVPADHMTLAAPVNLAAATNAPFLNAPPKIGPILGMVEGSAEAQAKELRGPKYPGFANLSPLDQERTHIFFQIYFVMTGLHGLHVLIGMGLIFWVGVAAIKFGFGPHYYAPVDIVGLYWHLVDLIWIFLFPLLYLIH